MTVPAFAQDAYTPPFTLEKREAAKHVDRYGDLSLGAVIRTDERYNKEGLFPGPRGWAYWNYLQNPKPYQDPNLWPDKRPTYFFGEMVLPAGSALTIHGRFPYARYFKFNFYAFEHNTFVAMAGAALAGADIEPDPGSGNPFRIGADRQVKNRTFTIHVLAEDPPKNPADHPKNTVYVGTDGKLLAGGFRIYVSDEGYDGASWGPAYNASLEGPGITYEGQTTSDAPSLLGDWIVLQTNGIGSETVASSIVAVHQQDAAKMKVLFPFGPLKPGEWSFAPPKPQTDPENSMIYSADMGVGKVAGIKLDQATGEMTTVFVIENATSAFQPLIGPKDQRVLLLSNFKRRVTAEPLKLALFTGNYTEQVTWRDAATGRIIAESDFFEPLTIGSLITPGFGSRVYFPTGKGFITMQVMPAAGTSSSR
jgi:hypothetical protein